MENSFFIYTEKEKSIDIERFHICTWEFNTDSSLLEFGAEISQESIKSDRLSISLFIPWFTKECKVEDLYERLSIAENSRFIFNDSLAGTDSLDGGRNRLGVIHKFSQRNKLCILPVEFDMSNDNIITVNIDLKSYNENGLEEKPNIYFRFLVKPNFPFLSTRKKGIGKSTIIYDAKVNEMRNIPDNQLSYFNNKAFCKIKTCFFFNIIPNKYDIIFLDDSSLKNVRTLEYDSFNKYLQDKRVKKDELMVVFNKKRDAESFSFFSIFAKERIGPGQFALAILINLVCGILLFIPAYRKTVIPEAILSELLLELPTEVFIALVIATLTLLYFSWPFISNTLKIIGNWFSEKLKSSKK